ncbi:ComEC/Rec2 family competence protein [Chitinophaga agri]|uniref:ComEC family competence protein n=1 Tax=Chitinophaga agri TaxID=2703787 RepID=A0A6B9ZHA9_9BACT|nr:ComEC/Rec2 family competence protein [Chitinophaga agri]QHS61838.1 ComEC family competence protein [Chitinophaga agri]
MFVSLVKSAPFLRLVLCLSTGVFIQVFLPLRLLIILSAAGLATIALWFLSFLALRYQYRADWLRGIALQMLVICSGGVLFHLSDVRDHPHYFEKMVKPGDYLLVQITVPVQHAGKRLKTMVAVRYIVRDNMCIAAEGKLLVYLEADSSAVRLQTSDQLLIDSHTETVGRNGNPGAFDYNRYCALQQVYRQAYLREKHWYKLLWGDENVWRNRLQQSRSYCLRILQQYIGGKEAGLASALLIGYRYDLDRELVRDYTNTGIVHIIAISGMHLALIYGALLWLTQWWPQQRYTNIVKGVLIILVLWAFTLLTGGAASVLRATVMFTFLTIGKCMLARHTNVYNTLAASAFILLCYEPRLLVDVGFQLSYLAVLSIVVCYRRLYHLIHIDNKWLSKLWDMTALTLAAQLFTIPACLYYFHQFPLYFLPANLLAVPLSTVVLYAEIFLLPFGNMPVIADKIGMLLKGLMQCMNSLTGIIGHLPGALITGVDIQLISVVCMYGCIGALLILLSQRWRIGVLLMLISTACWSAGVMFLRISEQHQHKMVVYNIPGHTVIDIIQGRSAAMVSGEEIADSLYERYLRPAHALYGVKHRPSFNDREEDSCQLPGFRIRAVGDKRLVVVDSLLPDRYPQKKIRTDYLLLSHNPRVDIRQLERMFCVDRYIFDASNSRLNIQRWKSDCYVLTLRFFSVPDQGAFVINF